MSYERCRPRVPSRDAECEKYLIFRKNTRQACVSMRPTMTNCPHNDSCRYVAGAKLDAHFERESAARQEEPRSPSPSQEPPPTGPSTSATSDIRERKRATPTDPAEVSGSARGKRHVGCLFSCFPSHEFA